MRYMGRLIDPDVPHRFGREVRGVGFHENPVVRYEQGAGADVFGRLERRNARETHHRSDIQHAAYLVGPAGKRMEHHRSPLDAGFADNRHRVVKGLTRVDHDNLAQLRGQCELLGEYFLLTGAGRVVVVIVQTDLADRDISLVGGQLLDIGQILLVLLGCVVRMDAGGAEDLGVL